MGHYDEFMNEGSAKQKLYIQSKYNQIGNATNPYQGSDIKVLCVCSAGLLRSATIADVLVKAGGFNVRNCGTSLDYALIPLSSALLAWADKVIVVQEQAHIVEGALADLGWSDGVDVITLDIPDIYRRNDPELIKIITEALTEAGILKLAL